MVEKQAPGEDAVGGGGRVKLHDYWRSTASYRVRIALNLKGLAYESLPLDLRVGEQRSPAYLAINPQGLAPTLEEDGHVMTQSGAILEWLEETCPNPALLPEGSFDRQAVRAMAAIIGCDIHPINNLRILSALRDMYGVTDTSAWITRWMTEGFIALEARIEQYGGRFAFGDQPTFADCYLTPQVYSANRFNVDLGPFPAIRRVTANAADLAAFQGAHPDVVAKAHGI